MGVVKGYMIAPSILVPTRDQKRVTDGAPSAGQRRTQVDAALNIRRTGEESYGVQVALVRIFAPEKPASAVT